MTTRSALIRVLAVSGRPTAADVLSEATGLDAMRMHSALGQLIDRRVAQEVPGVGLSFRLSHDRLRETIYQDLEPGERRKLHLDLARAMERVWARELEEHVLDVADHYNAAAQCLDGPTEREKAARYNELAGFESKNSGSFEAAGKYFRSAMAFLPVDSWSVDYVRAATVSNALMEVEYLGKDLERAERHWQRHVTLARTKLEKAEAYVVKADALTHLGRLNEALTTLREGFPFLGVRYPVRPGKLSIGGLLLRLQWMLRKRTRKDLLALEDLAQDEQRTLLSLLSSGLAPAFLTYQEGLFSYYALRGVQIAARWGNDPMAAFMYAAYAFVRQQALGDIEAGRTVGDLALELTRRYDAPYASGRTLFMLAAFVFPWTRPLQALQELLLEGHRQSVRGGDLLFAGFQLNVAITQQCMFSPSVDASLRFIEAHEDFLIRLDNPHTIAEVAALRQMLLCLAGKTRNDSTFDTDAFDDKRFYRELLELDDRICIGFYLAFRLKALFIMGLYEDAFELAAEAERRMAATRGQFVYAEHAFFHALTLARQATTAAAGKRRRLLRGIVKKKRLLEKWARSCPENFQHKQLLVEAELARLGSDSTNARRLYDQARASADAAGFPLNATIACELTGRFELEQGRREEARARLTEARDGYETWGAVAKVKRLGQEAG